MESYIVRVYRGEKDDPRNFVGIVEEVDTGEKKAFTNLEELWNILNSIKHRLTDPATRIVLKKENEKRKESRIRKEIPLSFIYHKHKLKASSLNYSKHGLAVQIHKKVSLPRGDIFSIKSREATAKAETIWVDDESNPSTTTAGFHLIEGKLHLKGAKKDMHVVMRGR